MSLVAKILYRSRLVLVNSFFSLFLKQFVVMILLLVRFSHLVSSSLDNWIMRLLIEESFYYFSLRFSLFLLITVDFRVYLDWDLKILTGLSLSILISSLLEELFFWLVARKPLKLGFSSKLDRVIEVFLFVSSKICKPFTQMTLFCS